MLGPHATVSLVWAIPTFVLMAAHTAFALLFAWIDGEAFRIGAGAESDANSGSDGSSGDGSGGGGGDGSSAG